MNTDRDDTAGKESACNAGIPSLGGEDPLQEEMATHSSILAWKIPWTEEPGGLYSPWGRKESDSTKHTQVSQVNIYNIYLRVKAY